MAMRRMAYPLMSFCSQKGMSTVPTMKPMMMPEMSVQHSLRMKESSIFSLGSWVISETMLSRYVKK